jgi:type I restriction-modification system DNA methylase subunit
MIWIAPSEKDTDNAALENRLWDAADRFRANSGLKSQEYFLGEFTMSEGQGGGEFYTPSSIVRLLTEVIEPYHGRKARQNVGGGARPRGGHERAAHHEAISRQIQGSPRESTRRALQLGVR